ncbi:MAG: M48 family metallopeptidase [Synergistales bacterium]
MWSLFFWLSLSLGALIETTLVLGQWGWLNKLDRAVPPALAPLLPEGYGWWRGVSYARELLRVFLGSLLTRYAGLAVIVGAGGLAGMSRLAEKAFSGPIEAGFALGAMTVAVMSLLDLPWGLYGTFRVETRFGFNRSSIGLYLRDTLLKISLSVALAGFMAAAAAFLVSRPCGFAWALAGVAVFDVAVAFFFPSLVLPLFYRLRPLPDGPLKTRIESLFERTGFPASALLVADESRRSTHRNAFFAGFGRSRRVVLFDTLSENFPDDEAAAVVAHEIGHWKENHVPVGIGLLFAAQSTLVLFAAFAWQEGGLTEAFGLPPRAEAFVVMIAVYWSAIAGLFLQPLLSASSRRREFEADRYAAAFEGPEALIRALARLATDSLAWTPSEPRFSAWYATHPSTAERILALKSRERPPISGK